MTLEIQVLAWDRHKNVVELNRLNPSPPFLIAGSLPSILDNWISNGNTYVNSCKIARREKLGYSIEICITSFMKGYVYWLFPRDRNKKSADFIF
jgi:hypothetical protein